MAIEVAKYKVTMALRAIKEEQGLDPDLSVSVLRHRTDLLYREFAEGQSKNKPAGTEFYITYLDNELRRGA